MKEFFNNQRNAFLSFMGVIVILFIFWYFSLHQKIQSSYNINKINYSSLTQSRDLYKRMERGLPGIADEWKTLNESFKVTLSKIPHKGNYDDAINALYNLLIKHNFEIDTFSPSKVPLEKKYIKIQNSQDTVLVEKYPIDIQLIGEFVELGEFLDAMKSLPYRITANNIQILNGASNESQKIKLIAYMYLKSGEKMYEQAAKPKEPVKTKLAKVNPIKNTPVEKVAIEQPKPIGTDRSNPFKNMTLGTANHNARKLKLETFWWTNNAGIYFSGDHTRSNGLGDIVTINKTGKLSVY